jgi:hypothetical protein
MMNVRGELVNIPQWNGRPYDCGEVFRLQKNGHEAVCTLWSHPIGGEVRVLVDGELWCSEAKRDGAALVDLALEWKQQFEAKGWQ